MHYICTPSPHTTRTTPYPQLWVPGLVVATVYLQYHYAVDAVFGVALGLMMPPLALGLDRSVGRVV